MLHPSYLELRDRIVDDKEEKDLNRFSLIIGTAKRARQIIEEENLRSRQDIPDMNKKPSDDYSKPKPVSQAVSEIYDDQVHILEGDMKEA